MSTTEICISPGDTVKLKCVTQPQESSDSPSFGKQVYTKTRSLREITILNEKRIASPEELDKIRKTTQWDLRPLLIRQVLVKGRNLYFTDAKLGVQFSVAYDGDSTIQYLATDSNGLDLPLVVFEALEDKKCYLKNSTPPATLTEIPCDQIVIIESD